MKQSLLKMKYGGQTIILVTLFFVVIATTLVFNLTTPLLKEVTSARDLVKSKESYFLSEAGVEDVVYRLQKAKQYTSPEVISLNGSYATTTIADVLGNKEVTAAGLIQQNIRRAKVVMGLGGSGAFFYGIQTGQGGFIMENSSTVTGNVYANGPVEGSGHVGAGKAEIYGDAVSTGGTGIIKNIKIKNSAFAHELLNVDIDDGNPATEHHAYYFSSSTYSGVTGSPQLHVGSPDQPVTPFPLTDAAVDEYNASAEAGGVISSPCPYIIETDVTIGPVKITCDTVIKGNNVDITLNGNNVDITLNGNIWIVGNLTIQTSPNISINPSLGAQSIAIVAHDPDNQSTKGKIVIQQSPTFYGSGASNSYVMFLSQNNSAELGGTEVAINIQNNASGKLFVYAGHGEVLMENSASLKEVTAHTIHLKNSANVEYETGLQSLLFSAGPSGGYDISSWAEVE